MKQKWSVLLGISLPIVMIGAILAVSQVQSSTPYIASRTSPSPAGSIPLITLQTAAATTEVAETAAATPDEQPTPTAPAPEPTPQPQPTPKPAPKTPVQSTPQKVRASTQAVTAAPKPTPVPQPAETCSGSFTQEFLCLLNQYRASKGKGKLSYNNSLAAVALSHSNWMDDTGTFSHEGANGSRLGQRCAAAGITCRAENLAKGAKSAQNLLDLWKNSPGHNANLLGAYSTMGLGIDGNYITLLLN